MSCKPVCSIAPPLRAGIALALYPCHTACSPPHIDPSALHAKTSNYDHAMSVTQQPDSATLQRSLNNGCAPQLPEDILDARGLSQSPHVPATPVQWTWHRFPACGLSGRSGAAPLRVAPSWTWTALRSARELCSQANLILLRTAHETTHTQGMHPLQEILATRTLTVLRRRRRAAGVWTSADGLVATGPLVSGWSRCLK
jgi:hypothetical protein